MVLMVSMVLRALLGLADGVDGIEALMVLDTNAPGTRYHLQVPLGPSTTIPKRESLMVYLAAQIASLGPPEGLEIRIPSPSSPLPKSSKEARAYPLDGIRGPIIYSPRAILMVYRTDATAANRKLSTGKIQRVFQPHRAWRDVRRDGTRGLQEPVRQTINDQPCAAFWYRLLISSTIVYTTTSLSASSKTTPSPAINFPPIHRTPLALPGSATVGLSGGVPLRICLRSD